MFVRRSACLASLFQRSQRIAPRMAKKKAQRPKVVGPTCVQTLRGQLFGHDVALILCGEAHEEVVDLTRANAVVEARS